MNQNISKDRSRNIRLCTELKSNIEKINRLFVDDYKQTENIESIDNCKLSSLASKSILNTVLYDTKTDYLSLFFDSEETKQTNTNANFSFNHFFNESLKTTSNYCINKPKTIDSNNGTTLNVNTRKETIENLQKLDLFVKYPESIQNDAGYQSTLYKNEISENKSNTEKIQENEKKIQQIAPKTRSNIRNKEVGFISYKSGQEYFAKRFFEDDNIKSQTSINVNVHSTDINNKETKQETEADDKKSMLYNKNDINIENLLIECKDKDYTKKKVKSKTKHTLKNKKLTYLVKCSKSQVKKETKQKVTRLIKKDRSTNEKIIILLEYMAKKEAENNLTKNNTLQNSTTKNDIKIDLHAQSNGLPQKNEFTTTKLDNSKSVDYSTNITKGKTKNLIDFYNDFCSKKAQNNNFDFGFDKLMTKKEDHQTKNNLQENTCKIDEVRKKLLEINLLIKNENKNNFEFNSTKKKNGDNKAINQTNNENKNNSDFNSTKKKNEDNKAINHTKNENDLSVQNLDITNAELSKLLPGKKVYFGSQKIKEYGGDFYAVLDDFKFYEYTEQEMKMSDHLYEIESDATITNSENTNTIDNNQHNSIINNKNDFISYYKKDLDFTFTESSYYKRDFSIKIDNLENDKRTTVMLKNIPNKYTQKMLLDLLNEHHSKTYNFVYLKMDMKNKCNIGYAFINFISHKVIKSFFIKVNGKGWKKLKSCKIARVNYASIQGFDNLVRKFELCQENENEEYKPFILHKKDYINKQN